MSRLLTLTTATATSSALSSGAHTAHPTTNGSMYAYTYSTTDTAFADDGVTCLANA
jgi:hypothetical protein